jgi:hypothetical protein
VAEVEPEPEPELEQVPEPEPEIEPEPEPVVEMEPELEPEPEPVAEVEPEAALELQTEFEPEPEPDIESVSSTTSDLDDLLRSLSPEGDVDLLEPTEPTSGVISTDAYLAEFEVDSALSYGLGDEITALTGGGTNSRSRPVATVGKLPESDAGVTLHRDQLVDKELVMKIIEGIEKL